MALPKGWTKERLGSLACPRVERVDPAQAGDMPYVGLEHVEAHTMQLLGSVPAEMMKSTCLRYEAGDVLYGRLRPYLNKVAKPRQQGTCSPEFIVFSDQEWLRADFLRYRLNSRDFVNFASHLNTGDRPRVDFEQLSNFNLEVPPAAEQQRIAGKLDELFSDLDAGVASLSRAQGNLKRYRASVLKAAVEGRLTAEWRQQHSPSETGAELLARLLREHRLRWEEAQLARYETSGKTPPKRWREKYVGPMLPDVRTLSALPEGWCWATTEIVGDVLLGRQRAPQYLTGRWTRSYLRVANIKDDRIDYSDLESMDFDEAHFEKYRIESGDILVSEGQSPELVGQSAIFRSFHKPLCFQKTLHRFRAYPGITSPEFAQVVFRSHVQSGVFRALASITTNIAHLTLEKFEAAPFPVPPLQEQCAILALVDAQLTTITAMERSIGDTSTRGAALRQAVLKHAFAGKLVPQDPADEPASTLVERVRSARNEAPARKTRARAKGTPPASPAAKRRGVPGAAVPAGGSKRRLDRLRKGR